ncbi:MAG: fluoride efflux transporter CrcB [Candidatus Aminicenantes bacterium]|nr:fluoride efflux transporter CrcB [Candidatus Aminicenantes bacterium]
MNKIILVGIGGFIGAALRYLLSGYVQDLLRNTDFPHGTFVVNITGCFLIGVLSYLVESQAAIPAEMRLLIMVGILGSFTTFSTFSNETMIMLQNQRIYAALINISIHIIVGLSSVLLGRFTTAVMWR